MLVSNQDARDHTSGGMVNVGNRTFSSSNWKEIKLVVFDVDGTLYNQRSLRWRMAVELLAYSLRQLNWTAIKALRTYRSVRELLGEVEFDDFELELNRRTCMATGLSDLALAGIVSEWIYQRPLRYLRACKFAGLDSLFTGLRTHGKLIGILSDYPASAKLASLRLSADFVVSATDDNVRMLKPDPRGLQLLMQRAGVSPNETLFIGDRADRDGLVARRAGTHCLVLSKRLIPDYQTFAGYNDQLFDGIRT